MSTHCKKTKSGGKDQTHITQPRHTPERGTHRTRTRSGEPPSGQVSPRAHCDPCPPADISTVPERCAPAALAPPAAAPLSARLVLCHRLQSPLAPPPQRLHPTRSRVNLEGLPMACPSKRRDGMQSLPPPYLQSPPNRLRPPTRAPHATGAHPTTLSAWR